MNEQSIVSRFKNMPGVAWLVIGVCVTALVLPSAAYATGVLKQVGIEGTSANRADVTPAGQVLSAEAQPSNLFGGSSQDWGTINAGSSLTDQGVITAPSTKAVIMDSLSMNAYNWNGNAGSFYTLFIATNSTCGTEVGNWAVEVSPIAPGPIEMPLTPGVAIPAGDVLCTESSAAGGSFDVWVTAMGSLVPSASVTNAPLQAAPKAPAIG